MEPCVCQEFLGDDCTAYYAFSLFLGNSFASDRSCDIMSTRRLTLRTFRAEITENYKQTVFHSIYD